MAAGMSWAVVLLVGCALLLVVSGQSVGIIVLFQMGSGGENV
jgi:hypothetical protein